MKRAPVVVIGIGNRMRGDDGIGAAVAARLDPAPEVEIQILDGEPTRVIDAWAGRRKAVVVDAIRTGAPPGTLHRVDPAAAPPTAAPTSSHGAGLAAAIELGRALDQLPTELVVVGLEPADTSVGPELSPPVAAALDDLVAVVETACDEAEPA